MGGDYNNKTKKRAESLLLFYCERVPVIRFERIFEFLMVPPSQS